MPVMSILATHNNIPDRGLFLLGFNFHYVAKMLKLIPLGFLLQYKFNGKHHQNVKKPVKIF